MKVTMLAEYRHRHELAVLRHLTKRVLQGEVCALAICTKGTDNSEEIHLTGDYRNNPGQGVGAAMKMSWRLTQLADEREAH